MGFSRGLSIMSKSIQVTLVRWDRPIGAARLLATTALRYAIPIAFPTWSGEVQLDPARRIRGHGIAALGTITGLDGESIDVDCVELIEPTRVGSPFWVVVHARGGRDPLRGTTQITTCATQFVSVADVLADQQRDVLTMPDEMVIEELRACKEPID